MIIYSAKHKNEQERAQGYFSCGGEWNMVGVWGGTDSMLGESTVTMASSLPASSGDPGIPCCLRPAGVAGAVAPPASFLADILFMLDPSERT